ncbi:hypothetical protein FP744_10004883 [Trichoderma asperellum]
MLRASEEHILFVVLIFILLSIRLGQRSIRNFVSVAIGAFTVWIISPASSTWGRFISTILLGLAIFMSPLGPVFIWALKILLSKGLQYAPTGLVPQPFREPTRPRQRRDHTYAEPPIRTLHDPRDADVDIVAVHGLGSSVETTWTHKQSGKLWLRDFLHLDFPKARIMTYCHNTSWQSQALGSNLSDHGAQLLGFLEGERNTEETLVLAKAAAADEDTKKRHKNIADSLAGAIFLGTPHAGSDYSLLGKIYCLFHYWDGANPLLLGYMDKGSEHIMNMENEFMKHYRGLSFDFYERVPNVILGMSFNMVVTRESGTRRGEEASPLDTNHFDLNKYSSNTDGSYMAIRNKIKQFLRSWNDVSELKLLKNLEPCRFKDEEKRKRSLTRGTCEWIIEENDFQNWVQNWSLENKILWILGNPGSGKTFIAQWLCEHFQEKKTNNLLKFFFDAKSEDFRDLRSLEKFYQTILYQLLAGIRKTFPKLKASSFKSVQQAVQREGPGKMSYFTALQVVLGQTEQSFLVVDALDECTDTDTDALKEWLEEIRGLPNLRILITSRPLREIKKLCDGSPRIQLNDMIIKLDKDIERFIIDRINKADSMFPREMPRVLEKLKDRSSGMILYAKLMLDILSVKAANEDELLAEMERIPENLSALYADRMNKITDKKFAKKILQWLVTCRRPLTLDSLRGVDIIGRYVGSEGRFDLDRDQPPEGLGKDRSGNDRFEAFLRENLLPLIEILPDKTVRLVHTTVSQFLLGEEIEEEGARCPSDLKVHLDVGHEDIAVSCVTYLRWSLGSTRRAYNATSVAFLDNRDLREYAVLEWPYHCGRSKEKIMANEKERMAVTAFFSDRDTFPSWLTARAELDGVFRAHFGLDGGDSTLPQPPHVAVFFDIWLLVKPLVAGTDVNLRDATGSTVLHIAAGRGYPHIVKDLLEQGARMDLADSSGAYPLHRAVRRGNYETLEQLLKHVTDPKLVDVPDKYKFTPMHVACQLGWTKCVGILLKCGASLSNEGGAIETPVGLAIENGHIGVVRTLLEHSPSLVDNCRKPLIQAARRGSIEMVKFLCEAGVDTSYEDLLGQTVLHKACIFGDLDLVEYLLDTCAVLVDARDKSERTPLYFAAEKGHLDVVDSLLRHRANTNSLDRRRETALFKPAGNGHVKVVERLLKSGIDATILDLWKRTPLRFAAMKGHREVVRLLLEKTQIQQDLPDWVGRTVLHNAAAYLREGQEDVIDILFRHGAQPEARDITGGTALHAAVLRQPGHPPPTVALLDRLIQNGVSLDAQDNHGRTALFIAAAVKDFPAVKCLLSAGAAADNKAFHMAVRSGNITLVTPFLEQRDSKLELSEVDEDGNTPLHIAASRGDNDIADVLIRAGAPTKCINMDQHTPLEVANRSMRSDTVRILRRADPTPEGGSLEIRITASDSAQLNTQDDLSRTPLHTAVLLGRLAAVNQLLESQASTDIPDQIGRTPLHYAARRLDPAILKVLIAAKANVNVVDARNKSPLCLAVEMGNITGIQMLLTAGADFIADHEGRTPLHAAALKGSADIVRTLLPEDDETRREELISISDHRGETAIHLAAEQGHDDVVEELLKPSQDLAVIDKKNHENQTALFVASRSGHLNIVLQLIKAGSIIYRIDDNRNMAVHIAANKGYPEIIKVLLKELPSQMESAIEKWKEGLPEWPYDEACREEALLIALHKAGGIEEYPTSTGPVWRTNLSKWTALEDLQKLRAAVLSNLRIFDEDRLSIASTSLMQAVLGGQTEVVKLLLDSIPEMPLQAEHYNFHTALSLAAHRGHVEIAKLLIAAGAKVDAITDRQETCLHSAAEAGHHQLVQLLLQNNANPDLACLRGGFTPLHLAAKGGHEAAVRVLAAVAFVNAMDDLGRTPLHVACMDGHNGAVNALVDADADLAAHDFERRTPLELVENLDDKTRTHMEEQAEKQRQRRKAGR